MKLSNTQINQNKKRIDLMTPAKLQEFKQIISMSNADEESKEILRDYTDQRLDKLFGKESAEIVHGDFSDFEGSYA